MNEKEEETLRAPLEIDDTFIDVKDESITFSVHKVEKKILSDLQSDMKSFTEIIQKLHDQLESEYKAKIPPTLNKSINTASIEGKKMLAEKAEFPYGSKKLSQTAAIYGSPTKYTKGLSPKKKFQGLGTLQDTSLRHEKNEDASYINSYFSGSLASVHFAFVERQHLALSPSDFVILIGQGLAYHINRNPDKMRHCFLDHDGRSNLRIFNTVMQLNGISDWSMVFETFADELKRNVKKDMYSVVIDNLSTATPASRVVSEMSLMDCMKNYSKYVNMEGCGFPKITLKGTPDDWKKFHGKVRLLLEMNKGDCLDLDWWLKHLIPVVEKICEAGIDRQVDRNFWGSICQNHKEFGEITTGWINVFCPYLYSKLHGLRRNFVYKNNMKEDFTFIDGVEQNEFCEGISKVPFIFEDKILIRHSMHCYSGCLGGKYDAKNDWIEPAYFWSIYEDPKK